MKFSFYMVASIACDSVDLMWKWRLILMCFCVSSAHEQISDQMCEFFDNGTIILKKLGEFSDAPLHTKQSFYSKCDCLHTLSFELYPNFKFSIELIDEVLSELDLIIISIRFDDELKKLVRRRKVSSNEYVDRFLENFIHTQSSVMLDFSSLRLSDIPESIYKFNDLKILIFYNMDLKIFKLDCERLKELISLKICESKKITELDESIFNLPSLLSLKISGCSIKEIPDDINKLKDLSSLEIAKSPIKSLPRNLSNLKSLYSLTISDCALKEIVISMAEHPKLVNVYLNSNYSLKCLKLLILEIHKGFDNFEISGCPLKEVEIWLNLNIPKFCTLSHDDQKLENFDYLIKFNPIKMFSFPKNKRKSDSKIYEFNISAASSGPNRIISIREFRFKKTRTRVVNKYKLIVKWIKICEKFHFENTVGSC